MCTYIDYFLLGCTKNLFKQHHWTSNEQFNCRNALCVYYICVFRLESKTKWKIYKCLDQIYHIGKIKGNNTDKICKLKKKQELGKFEQENNPEILDGSIGINNLYLLIYVY